MTADQADEVMAEYLLKGGKMLAKSCKVCGYPLFEYKGETRCVICPLAAQKEPLPEPEPPALAPESGQSPAPAAREEQGEAAAEIERTIVHLCERIRVEQRPDECLTLMKAVKKGAEALAALAQR
ncbi:MAG TPA: Sjogren's syndrome/scleroderma autoantigen 1 family protein [Methanoculleus sp.]|nr:Sjogren's syndrome/scleroderma autoantigen 1 family protein [Methanoculleus sp.]